MLVTVAGGSVVTTTEKDVERESDVMVTTWNWVSVGMVAQDMANVGLNPRWKEGSWKRSLLFSGLRVLIECMPWAPSCLGLEAALGYDRPCSRPNLPQQVCYWRCCQMYLTYCHSMSTSLIPILIPEVMCIFWAAPPKFPYWKFASRSYLRFARYWLLRRVVWVVHSLSGITRHQKR